MPSRLSSLLVRDGVVGVRRMEKAFQRQVLYGGSLDTILLELGMVPEDRLCQYLALASGLPPASREECEALEPSVAALLPLEQAQAYRAVPLALEGDAIRMAVAAPIDLAALEDLADHVDRPLRPLLVPEYRWHVMLEQAYGIATPQRFAALASQIERDTATQPVGRSRTVIVDNEPERDIVASAQTVLAAPPVEQQRARSRTTDAPVRRAAAPAATAPPPPRAVDELEILSESPTPTETVQGLGMRRRATLIGVSPVRALTDEPLTGDLIAVGAAEPSTGVPLPAETELEAAERRGPLYDDAYDRRPTGQRRASTSPDRPAHADEPTRPLARRRPSPESLASISAASLAAIDEAQPLPLEDELEAPASTRSPTRPSRRLRPDTVDTEITEVPSTPPPTTEPLPTAASEPASELAAAPSGATSMTVEPAAPAEVPEPLVSAAAGSRASPRASTQPIHLPAETSPISLREARELLLHAEQRDDVLIALLRAMRQVARWAGLLTVHGGVAIGRIALAHPGLDADKISTVLIPLDAPSPVRTAVTSKRPYVGPLAKGDAAVDSMFLRMGDVRPPSVAVIPVVLRDRVVALIVGHSGAEELGFSDVAELLPLAAVASEAIGRLILRHKTDTAKSAAVRPSSPSILPLTTARPSSPSIGAPTRSSAPSVTPPAARPSSPSMPRPSRATPSGVRSILPALPSYETASGTRPETAREPGSSSAASSAPEPEPEPEPEPAPLVAARPRRVSPAPSPTAPALAAALEPRGYGDLPALTTAVAGSAPLAAAPALLTIDELLDIVEQRRPAELEAAFDEAIARAPEVLPALAARFPGELEFDRYAVTGRPLRAAQYGGLLELVTRLGAAATDLLLDKLTAPARDVRFYATVCITELRPRSALPALIDRLFDPDFGVRICALEALAGYPARDLEAGLARIRQALHADDAQRVAAAAHAVAELADRDAVPDLLAALARGERFAEVARRALLALTKQDLGSSERKWQRWWEENSRRHRVQWLIDALLHKESELRTAAITELRRLIGESLGYEAEAPRRERELAHQRWLDWWRDAGQERFTAPESQRRRPTGPPPSRL